MKKKELSHRLAGLFFVFALGLGLVWAADDGRHQPGDVWFMLLALGLLLWGVYQLLHLLADLWSESE